MTKMTPTTFPRRLKSVLTLVEVNPWTCSMWPLARTSHHRWNSLPYSLEQSCCFPRCGTLTTISTNSTITPASKPTALACLPQPCDTHKRLLPPSSSCGKPVTCSWRYIRDLRGSQYLSSSLNSCDTLAKFIVDPLIVVNQ